MRIGGVALAPPRPMARREQSRAEAVRRPLLLVPGSRRNILPLPLGAPSCPGSSPVIAPVHASASGRAKIAMEGFTSVPHDNDNRSRSCVLMAATGADRSDNIRAPPLSASPRIFRHMRRSRRGASQPKEIELLC